MNSMSFHSILAADRGHRRAVGTTPPSQREWNAEQAGAFTAPNTLKPHHRSCSETIRRVAEEPARVLLLNIQDDPQYKRLMDELGRNPRICIRTARPGIWRRQAFLLHQYARRIHAISLRPGLQLPAASQRQENRLHVGPGQSLRIARWRIDNYSSFSAIRTSNHNQRIPSTNS